MDIHVVSYLAGGIPTPLKNMSKSVGVIIPNLWKNKKTFQTTNQIWFHDSIRSHGDFSGSNRILDRVDMGFSQQKKLISLDFMTCFYGSPVFVYPRVYFSNAKKDMFFDNNPTRIVIIQYRLSMLGALYMSSFDFTWVYVNIEWVYYIYMWILYLIIVRCMIYHMICTKLYILCCIQIRDIHRYPRWPPNDLPFGYQITWSYGGYIYSQMGL